MEEARITIDAQVQLRRDTEANWSSVNPVLRDGEAAYSKDVHRLKIGDGARHWADLPYILGGSGGGGGESGESGDLDDVMRRLGIAESEIAELYAFVGAIGSGVTLASLLGGYLPLSGGTISNDYEEAPLKIATTAYEWVALRLKTKTSAIGGSLVYAGGSEWKVTDDGWNQSYALLHEGNFTNYALSKSGTAADSDKLKGKGAWEYFQRYGTIRSQSDMDALDKARCGVYQINHYSPVEGAYDYGQLLNFHDIAGVAQIYFADYNRGVYVRYNWNGYSQDVGSWKRLAYTTDNVASADIAKTAERLTKTLSNESINLWQNDGVQMISVTDEGYEAFGAPKRWISGLSVLTSYVGWQLVCGASRWNSTDFFIRKRSDENTFTEWKTLAFLDSNVASATKLATSRKIWGQSFDGSADISGALTGVSYIAMNGHIGGLTYINDNATNGFMFGSRSAVGSEGGALIYAYGNTPISMYAGGWERMHIASNGNVGIGTDEPAYKLDVRGNLATIGDIRLREGSFYLQNDKSLRFYLNGNSTDMDVFRVSTSNEIEIGGDAPSYGVNTIIKGKKIILRQNIWDTRLEIAENGDTYINKNLNLAGTAYINGEIYLGNDAEGIFYYKSIPRLCYHNQGTWVSNLITFEHTKVTMHQDTVFNGSIKIGDATISWDASANALKVDKNFYSPNQVSAGGRA